MFMFDTNIEDLVQMTVVAGSFFPISRDANAFSYSCLVRDFQNKECLQARQGSDFDYVKQVLV